MNPYFPEFFPANSCAAGPNTKMVFESRTSAVNDFYFLCDKDMFYGGAAIELISE